MGDNDTSPEGIMGLMKPKGPVMQPKGRRPEGCITGPEGCIEPLIPKGEV